MKRPDSTPPRPAAFLSSSFARVAASFARVAATALGLIFCLALGASSARAAAGPDPLESASSGGLAALDRALARLASNERLLVIAAHPDDEDTRLLTLITRGRGGESAYLSLSRGEGGQNLIGPELGVGLGLLRSRELLAARGIDGARQFFTRAYDFGYTRSLEETFERWPEDVLLEDAVRVVRRFKPQVVVAVFPASSRSGHGQHWASGVVADKLLDLAGDPDAFPALAEEGLAPWRPTTFYRSAFFNRAGATLEMPLGTIEPFSGQSIFQISLLSRSQHRCQDMGRELPLGDATTALIWQEGGAGEAGEGIFAGVDTRLAAIAASLEDAALRSSVEELLGRVEALARAARRTLTPVTAGETVGPLLEIVRLLGTVDRDLAEAPVGSAGTRPGKRQARDLVGEKLTIAREGLATAAEILADAYTDRETVVPGERFSVNAVFWNAGSHTVEDLEIEVESPSGFRLVETAEPEEERSFFATEATAEPILTVEVPADTAPTIPYFLERPRRGDVYDWSAAPPEARGEPFAAPPLKLRFAFLLDGVPMELEREVVLRYRDQARGEVRRPLRVVPRLEVSAAPGLVVWPIGDLRESHVAVTVESNVDEPVRAHLELDLPAGWPRVEAPGIAIDEPRGRRTVVLPLRPPASFAGGRYEISVAAVTEDGARYADAFPLVDYEHIRATPRPEPARIEIAAGEIRLPERERIAWVRGASDRVPEFLRQIGLPLEVQTAGELADRELGGYDAIVVGSRAYETDPDLARLNPRLLEYARGGGLVVVQYQQYQFSRGGFAPYPLEINRPHDRVTDETAAVRVLDPDHPIFHVPNEIGAADWQGWIQERGLYFAGTWDAAYTPLLAMADPDGEDKTGALLVAPVGEGHYVYTGLAFFRQLPAGVVGAYRLFANLLAVGEGE